VQNKALQNKEDQQVEGLVALSRIILEGSSVAEVLQRISVLAAIGVDACDMASISLAPNNTTVKTVGASHEKVAALDQVQYATKQGPCVAAATETSPDHACVVYRVIDTAHDERWPDFSRAAAAAGMGSLTAFGLLVGDESFGALNLYSVRPNAFEQADLDAGVVFAAHAAVVLKNARALDDALKEVDELHQALDSRDTIGMAKGILMEREGVDDAQAFEILKHLSQHLNVKLRDIATQVAESPTVVVAD
jgi:GAF domain-containing protein